jgi:acyl carrier protein
MYGPTETSIDATSWTCRRGESLTKVPIGRPIANKRIYLLDAQLQHVPVGVPGELHIGGCGLARGYLNRPELTGEKFIPDPFSAEAGARLYRTGDRARFLPDGRIEYLGRVDYQIKIRGFRIEPGEIEAVLARHPDLDNALVIAREDVAGEKRLVAYVVGKPGVSPSGSELRSFMKAALPEHMVPGAYVIMDEVPLLPNGKIDRRSLPAPSSQQRNAESDYLAPRTETEQIIAEIWQEALQVERVGINDNFFDLGGHSILMLRVHGKLRDRFKREMEIVEMFRYPTVSMLAEHFVNQPVQQLSPQQSQTRAEQSRAATKRRKLLRQNQAAAIAVREYEHERPEQL